VSDGTKATAIRTMLDEELLVTINSDDPAYFPGYMNENFARVQREVDLTSDEVVRLVKYALRRVGSTPTLGLRTSTKSMRSSKPIPCRAALPRG
jgi:adenosine deaminase